MREIFKDHNIRVAYVVCLALGIAYGMVMAIVSLYLTTTRGYDDKTIAAVALFFSVGIAAFAVPMGALVRKVSARFVIAVALVGYGLSVIVFPFMPNFAGLAGARFADGAFSVGAWIGIETVLLLRTTSLTRGFVTSLYSIVLAMGYAIGSVITWGITKVWPDDSVFVAAGCLAALGGTLALLRLDPHIAPAEGSDHAPTPAADAAPAEPTPTGVSTAALYWRIKTACVPTFAYGYFQGSLVLLLPLFLMEERGIPKDSTKLMVAYFAAGMATFVVPMGRLGDRFGHLRTIRLAAGLGALVTVSVVYLPALPLIAAAVFIAGGALAPIWPLSLALQSLIVDPRDYNRSNALLNASYAVGTLAGPFASGAIRDAYGGAAMFWHLAGLWTFAMLTTIVFRRDDPSLRLRRPA